MTDVGPSRFVPSQTTLAKNILYSVKGVIYYKSCFHNEFSNVNLALSIYVKF